MQQLRPNWQNLHEDAITFLSVVQGFVVTHNGYSKTQQAAELKVSRKFSPPCTTRQAPRALDALQLLAVLRLIYCGLSMLHAVVYGWGYNLDPKTAVLASGVQ